MVPSGVGYAAFDIAIVLSVKDELSGTLKCSAQPFECASSAV